MKVLICLETGKDAETILNEANKFLKPYRVVYAYIHTIRNTAVLAAAQGFEDGLNREMEQEEVELYKQAEAVFGRGKFGFSVGAGIPAENILERTEELKCDLLILGTHGRTGLQHVLYGSVAEKVLRGAHCKMLVIPVKDYSF